MEHSTQTEGRPDAIGAHVIVTVERWVLVSALVLSALAGLIWCTAHAVGSTALGGLLAFVNFHLFFTAFHRLFFEGDTWLFPRSDTLIQLFPLPFWMDATFILALLPLAESLIVAAVAYVLSRRLSKTQ